MRHARWLVGTALVVSACGAFVPEPSGPCAPVDVGGECFMPSEEAFIDHALTSAGAWPQLDGVELSADRVIEGRDLSTGGPVWVVPLHAGDRMVAVSRFVPVEGRQVKLGEVALLDPPRAALPADLGGELTLFVQPDCARDNRAGECLFAAHAWAVQLDDGRFRMPDGQIVDDLPR